MTRSTLSMSPYPRLEKISSVEPSDSTNTLPGTPVFSVRLFMPLTNASRNVRSATTEAKATAVIRFVFHRTRTLRRLYTSGTLPIRNSSSRSAA